jgi:hypothetical protein
MKISFAHNVYDRPHRLRKTIEIERSLFPFSKIYVAYNHPRISQYFEIFKDLDVNFFYFAQQTHKIGCVNGAYFSVSMAMQDNPDVVIFSHDDVYISNPEVFTKHLNDIIGGKFDFIGRIPGNLPDIGREYMMMEAMLFSNSGARSIYKNFKPFADEFTIERDLRGSISPEVNMYNIVTKSLPEDRICAYLYNHENDPVLYNESLNDNLGFTHENIGMRGWKE